MNPHCSADLIPVKTRRRFRLSIPILLVWVLLLPFILLLVPLVFVAFLVARIDPFRAVWVYWEIFNSVRGLRVEVDDPDALIRIS
jgi:TRAP-type mannitol/chloroaromatic compound transport system permease small subunit